ncbi:hypothetical protein T10_2715 [Trichinella papuae]|uniref:Uncharacterized protein n=1 Tax=Trichinella papuae TaxID=268474 RepID=A0A0V1MAS0_9BILA|nr:hypothetical protein T10_2715 [Trichinella papuae]
MKPDLMKGATPNELVKGVTANRMSTIGKKTEPDLQNWDPWGTTYTVCLHSTVLLRVVLDLLRVVRVLLRVVLDLLRVVRVLTLSFLYCPYL